MIVRDDTGLREILTRARVIAVVGLSSEPSRPSHGVAAYLQRVGYEIIPVNPHETEVLGVAAVPSLRALAGREIDIVDVFRRPSEVRPHAEEAIAIGAKVLWLQIGVHDAGAEKLASDAGLAVVVSRCTLREHARLLK
jgi:predicted CoA-binding protein